MGWLGLASDWDAAGNVTLPDGRSIPVADIEPDNGEPGVLGKRGQAWD